MTYYVSTPAGHSGILWPLRLRKQLPWRNGKQPDGDLPERRFAASPGKSSLEVEVEESPPKTTHGAGSWFQSFFEQRIEGVYRQP